MIEILDPIINININTITYPVIINNIQYDFYIEYNNINNIINNNNNN